LKAQVSHNSFSTTKTWARKAIWWFD